MLYRFAYETPAFQGRHNLPNNSNIATAFKMEALIPKKEDFYHTSRPSWSRIPIYYLYSKRSLELIPRFTQPVVGTTINAANVEEHYVVVDVRSFVNSTKDTLTPSVSREFDFAHYRAATTAIWASGDISALKTDTVLAGRVFVNLIVNIIQRSLSLPLEDVVKVKVLSALYYGSMFMEPDDWTLSSGTRDVLRWTDLNTRAIDKIIETTGYINSVEALVTAIKANTDSTQIQRTLTSSLILQMASRSLFGSQAPETIVVGMWWPPLFIAAVASVVDNRGYSRTILGNLCDQQKRQESHGAMLEYSKRLQFVE